MLIREQGITIVSVLTAIGMVIGCLVEALIQGCASLHVSTPSPKPDSRGCKDWIKRQLQT